MNETNMRPGVRRAITLLGGAALLGALGVLAFRLTATPAEDELRPHALASWRCARACGAIRAACAVLDRLRPPPRLRNRVG